MAQVVVWGGEPLLRQDLPELLLAAREAGLFVTLITNGWHLRERWPELRGLVDALILSLDDAGAPTTACAVSPGSRPARGLRGNGPRRPSPAYAAAEHRAVEGEPWRAAPGGGRGPALGRGPLLLSHGDRRAQRRRGRRPARRSGALPRGAPGGGARSPCSSRPPGTRCSPRGRTCELLAADPALGAYICRAPRARLTVGADGSVRDCLHVDRPLASVAALRREGRVAGLALRRAAVAAHGGTRPRPAPSATTRT